MSSSLALASSPPAPKNVNLHHRPPQSSSHASPWAVDAFAPAASGPRSTASLANQQRWPELRADGIAANIARDEDMVENQRLHPEAVSWLVRGEGPRIGVILGLHGFTAGPWQYKELAQAYVGFGFDVYTPRMVGHGLRQAGEPYPAPMPDIDDDMVYAHYAEAVFMDARDYARAEGLPLLITAHSFGAVLAASLVQNHPEDIAGQVSLNPLQAPTSWAARLKFLVARVLRYTAWGRRWLNRTRHVFVESVDGQTWPGYPTLPLAKIFPVLNRARKVWRSFVTTCVPTLLMVSDCDKTCDPVPTLRDASRFFKNLSIHRFGRHKNVGHAMVSARENPRDDIRAIIYGESGAFLADCARRAGRISRSSTENT